MSTVGKNVEDFGLFVSLRALEPPTVLVTENNRLLSRAHRTKN